MYLEEIIWHGKIMELSSSRINCLSQIISWAGKLFAVGEIIWFENLKLDV